MISILRRLAPPSTFRALGLFLAAIAAVSGLLVCARAFLGPFRFVATVNSPLNLQSIFGLSATLALICRLTAPSPGGKPREPTPALFVRADWVSIAALILIGLAAFWQSLSCLFLSDDFYLVTIAASRTAHAPELFLHGGAKEFFRPVSGLLLVLTSLWAGVNPMYWHASNLLLHLANSFLVFLLATRLRLDRPTALIASVLFAIHGTRPEAVTWVSGRYDLLATFFVLIGIVLFIAWYNSRKPVFYLGSLLSMILGMLSKESAFAFPLLLPAVLAALPGTSRRDYLRTWPFWAVAFVTFALRWFALGGIGGYVDASSGTPQVYSFSVLQTAKALSLRIWSALYFPINWTVEPSLFLAALLLPGVVVVWAVAAARVEGRVVLFCTAFVVMSSLPALQQLLISSDLQKSRLLYLPSVGFCVMIAAALMAVRTKTVRVPAVLLLLSFHFACLRHNLDIWQDVAARANAVCETIVRDLPPDTKQIVVQGLPGSVDGVYFLRNGTRACLDLKAGRNLGVDVDTGTPASAIHDPTAVFRWDETTKTVSRTRQ
jgi:protein O-mannosyl-transferase